MSIGTRLFTWLRGRVVGTDADGNVYYTEKPRSGLRARRWVMYKGEAEASAVPAEWHSWLHYLSDQPLPTQGRRSWQKPHLANATGTATSYRPAGHDYQGGQRATAHSDYESWTPGA
jgi:NADH:ubiquinone oxidoreductase subunit